jgi:hypothetical protein
MATNIVALNVYQIDNRLPSGEANGSSFTSERIGFPTSGNILLWDTTNSPTRSLSSGVNVYAMIQISAAAAANSAGTRYYVQETVAQIIAEFNA